MSSGSAASSITQPFSQSWIQALMKAADNPVTRTIKPKLELIDQLSLNRGGEDRLAAANALWKYAEDTGLTDLLKVLPACQPNWSFDGDDRFLFQRREEAQIASPEDWTALLGIRPSQVALIGEVTNSDWTNLVRNEAVRQQKPLNSSAFGNSITVRPPCVGYWKDGLWTIHFDEIPWLMVTYEGPAQVERPTYAELEELITFSASEAEKLIPKHAGKSKFLPNAQPWLDCIPSLTPLHEAVLSPSCQLSPWLRKTWCCVWPTIYREQNVLREKADVELVRTEIAECIQSVPQLTVWMFVFAKLICQTQSGMGLGICADYTN